MNTHSYRAARRATTEFIAILGTLRASALAHPDLSDLLHIALGSSTVRTAQRRAPRTGICGAGSSPKCAEEQEQEQDSKFEKIGPLPRAQPARAGHIYRPPWLRSRSDAEGDYFPSYFEAGPSGTGDITVREYKISAHLRVTPS